MTPRKREPLYRKIGSRYEQVKGGPTWQMVAIVFVWLIVAASCAALMDYYDLLYRISIQIVPR